MIVAHRGGGLAEGATRFPENSIAAVKDAISLGASFRYQIIRETREDVSDKFTSFNIEARLSYWFNRALDKKMWFYGFAGTGYGMVQPQVTIREPQESK